MAYLMRTIARAPRARFTPASSFLQSRTYASSSYGNEQGGQEQGTHEKNPMQHMEHPGPEAPADQGKTANKPSDSSPGASQDTTGSDPTGQGSEAKNGAKPKIQQAFSPKEENDPDVKKHNDEMRNRADRSANQLSEEDNKVNKKFWKGEVGDMEQKKD